MKEKMQPEEAIEILEKTYIIAARRNGKIQHVKALALAINALRDKEEGYERAKKDFERLTGKCKKCDYRKFTEKCIDGIVEVMNKNGIASIEQLTEIIKGAEK